MTFTHARLDWGLVFALGLMILAVIVIVRRRRAIQLAWLAAMSALMFATASFAHAAGPVVGTATWYGTGPGEGHAAAGPRLRKALGKHWRNTLVQVCSSTACTVVRIDDWCGCNQRRIIDLSIPDFDRISDLSRGIVQVSVIPTTVIVRPPATHNAPRWSGSGGRLAC